MQLDRNVGMAGVAFLMLWVVAGLVAPAAAQGHGVPAHRFVPREVVVFPRNPADSRALALRMRSNGMLILARSPISGMVLAATPVEGLEAAFCEFTRAWPEVLAAERNVFGESFQPLANCPINPPTPMPCEAPYPPLQLATTPPPYETPDDPAFPLQWGLLNTGQEIVDRYSASYLPNSNGWCWTQVGVPGIDINLLPAWEFTTGSPLVTVAVLDRGVEYCNPDFDPARFLFPDMALTCVGTDDVLTYPCCPPPQHSEDVPCNWGPAGDNLGHGTVIAGIIGAVADNGIGIVGIDQQCGILSGRVFGFAGTGQWSANYFTVNAARLIIALETIAWLPAYRSVRVINMSSGIVEAALSPTTKAALVAAVDMLASQNRFLVAASGNSGLGQPDWLLPQNLPNVICVGSIDARGWRMESPYPGGGVSGTGVSLDFMAPGVADVTLICQSNPCPSCPYSTSACDDFYYRNLTHGTSWAAPKVAGAISLVLAHAIELGIVDPNPTVDPATWLELTFAQMYGLLQAGARDQASHVGVGLGDPLDTPGHDEYYGWGLIDIRASICALRAMVSQPCP